MKLLASHLKLDPATAHLIEQHPWITAVIVIVGIAILWIVVSKSQEVKLTRYQKKRSLILSAAAITVCMTSVLVLVIFEQIKYPNKFHYYEIIYYVFAPILILGVWLHAKQSIDKLPPE